MWGRHKGRSAVTFWSFCSRVLVVCKNEGCTCSHVLVVCKMTGRFVVVCEKIHIVFFEFLHFCETARNRAVGKKNMTCWSNTKPSYTENTRAQSPDQPDLAKFYTMGSNTYLCSGLFHAPVLIQICSAMQC